MFAALLVASMASTSADPSRVRVPERWPWSSTSAVALEAFERGLAAMDEGREAAARSAFEEAVAADPSFALAQALAARFSGGAADAPSRLARALAASATASPEERTWVRALHAFEVGGDSAAELAAYRELVTLRPSSARARYLLGWALVNHGRWLPAEAAAELEVAVHLDPFLPTAWNDLGYARKAVGDGAAAEAAFREYVRLTPGNANAYDSLAEMLVARGGYEEAERHYLRAVELDPGLLWPRLGLASLQRRDGRREAAEESLRRVVDLATNDRERRYARRALWVAAADLGELDRALELLAAEVARADAASERGAALSAAESLAVVRTYSGDLAAGNASFEEVARRIEAAIPAGLERSRRIVRLRLAELRLAVSRADRAAALASANAARLAVFPLAEDSRRPILEEIAVELLRLEGADVASAVATPLSRLTTARGFAGRGEHDKALGELAELLSRPALEDLELALARGSAWILRAQLLARDRGGHGSPSSALPR